MGQVFVAGSAHAIGLVLWDTVDEFEIVPAKTLGTVAAIGHE
jgi:hypothetical protein